MSVKLSAAIMTFNEERNIARCLQSLQGVVDEIVVVDSYSTDKTEEICKSFGVRFIQHPFEGYIEQRKYSIAQAEYDYVLAIDADEELSGKLKKSILEVKQNWTHDGYTFNRMTNFWGSWIRHGGWYPDRKMRLFDRRKACSAGINPHDRIAIVEGGTEKHIKGDLLHYSYYTMFEFIAQQNKFTDIASLEYYKRGRKSPSLCSIWIRSIWKFVRDYFFRWGFLDGYTGYIVCKLSANVTFIKYAKLRQLHDLEKKQKKTNPN